MTPEERAEYEARGYRVTDVPLEWESLTVEQCYESVGKYLREGDDVRREENILIITMSALVADVVTVLWRWESDVVLAEVG